jgi:hypothetical protein
MIAALLGPGMLPSGQAQQSESAKRKLLEGTEVFRRILCDKDCTPLSGFSDLERNAKHRILIVLGNLDSIAGMKFRKLDAFVRAGGAVLAASDRPLRSSEARDQLLEVSGVIISESTLGCKEENRCYKNFPFCPYVEPILGSDPFLFAIGGSVGEVNGATKRLEVATNVPSMLEVLDRGKRLPPGIERLARLPASSYLEHLPKLVGAEVPPLFAVGGELGDGRVLVLADHSIFINEMMLPPDNNNVEFTEECVDWLRGPGGQRNQVLFVEDGRIQTKFDIPLRSVNLPIEEVAKAIFERRNELLGEAEKVVGRLEDDNAFNRGLLNLLYGMGLPPRRLLGLAISFGALALLLYFIYRATRRRFRHEAAVPVLTHAVSRGLPVEPIAEQRHAELVQLGNLWEPASLMARRWFMRIGLERIDAEEPNFMALGSWWQRRKVIGRLRWLWRLASGRQPQRVSAPELWKLQRELDELRGAWERGAWRVAVGT